MPQGAGLLLVMTDIDPAIEDEFNRWYEGEHISERLDVPGVLRARRFKIVEGSPKYLALYDLQSPDVLQSDPYRHLLGAGKTALSKKMETEFRNLRRNVYVCISDHSRS